MRSGYGTRYILTSKWWLIVVAASTVTPVLLYRPLDFERDLLVGYIWRGTFLGIVKRLNTGPE